MGGYFGFETTFLLAPNFKEEDVKDFLKEDESLSDRGLENYLSFEKLENGLTEIRIFVGKDFSYSGMADVESGLKRLIYKFADFGSYAAKLMGSKQKVVVITSRCDDDQDDYMIGPARNVMAEQLRRYRAIIRRAKTSIQLLRNAKPRKGSPDATGLVEGGVP